MPNVGIKSFSFGISFMSRYPLEADKLAAGLLSLGVRKGDRVGIWSHNCPEWILVQYATARAGMILVNVNPSYQAAELEYALRK
ncbi:Medium-chain acyl-CoA ligase ACSF2, mitochondrial, partial [Lamellibrachia satsuma]